MVEEWAHHMGTSHLSPAQAFAYLINFFPFSGCQEYEEILRERPGEPGILWGLLWVPPDTTCVLTCVAVVCKQQ